MAGHEHKTTGQVRYHHYDVTGKMSHVTDKWTYQKLTDHDDYWWTTHPPLHTQNLACNFCYVSKTCVSQLDIIFIIS